MLCFICIKEKTCNIRLFSYARMYKVRCSKVINCIYIVDVVNINVSRDYMYAPLCIISFEKCMYVIRYYFILICHANDNKNRKKYFIRVILTADFII